MYRKYSGSTKCSRNERLAQLTEQESIIERKKREIQAKLEAQKKKEAEEALKKLDSLNYQRNLSQHPPELHNWTRKDTETEEKEVKCPRNAFSNDGSFLDQFKKLSGSGLGAVDASTFAKARKDELPAPSDDSSSSSTREKYLRQQPWIEQRRSPTRAYQSPPPNVHLRLPPLPPRNSNPTPVPFPMPDVQLPGVVSSPERACEGRNPSPVSSIEPPLPMVPHTIPPPNPIQVHNIPPPPPPPGGGGDDETDDRKWKSKSDEDAASLPESVDPSRTNTSRISPALSDDDDDDDDDEADNERFDNDVRTDSVETLTRHTGNAGDSDGHVSRYPSGECRLSGARDRIRGSGSKEEEEEEGEGSLGGGRDDSDTDSDDRTCSGKRRRGSGGRRRRGRRRRRSRSSRRHSEGDSSDSDSGSLRSYRKSARDAGYQADCEEDSKMADDARPRRVASRKAERRSSDESAAGGKKKRKKSRWGDEVVPSNASGGGLGIQLPASVVPLTGAPHGKTPLLSKLTRSDPGLLQYARQTFGSTNLSEEDWKKAEDHYKINLLYQDMVKKRAEIDSLEKAGKFKYEYDSDEDVEGGTWEHKLRQQEMMATQLWAEELTRQAAGKHHIGDFLPPEELERFMEKYNAVKEGRKPDLSDYKEFKLKEDNVGYRLLQKMGWNEGQGLGQDGTGITHPVNKASTRHENQGLGGDRPDGLEAGDDEYDAYRKRMMLAYRFRPNPLAKEKESQAMANDLKGAAVEGECGRLLEKYFLSDFRVAYRRYRGVTLPTRHDAFAERVDAMDVRDDDIWVASFPKTGTTWTQEMVWCIANDLNFEAAKEFLPQRFPFLEHSCLFDYTDVLPRKPGLVLPPFVADSVGFVDRLASPRFIKTHLPWVLLPRSIRTGEKKPKIVYVCRNVKDTCVSYYHHCILLEAYKGNFDDFCKLFLGDALCFAPYWSHVRDFWTRRDEANVLFITYEDMKKDLRSVVKKTCEFLGKTYSDDKIDLLCDHLSFESMKNNPAVNYEAVVEINRKFELIPADGEFMRKGTGGEWKGKMSNEMIETFDKWAEKNCSEMGMPTNNFL